MIESLGSIVLKVLDKIPIVEAWRSRSAGRREHDQGKFRELDNLLPETRLNQFLEDAYQHVLSRAVLHPVDQCLDWSGLVSNQFLITKVRDAHRRFARELQALRAFLSVNIFLVHGEPDVYYFRPDQDSSRGPTTPQDRALFDARSAELNRRTDSCELAYREFRRTVKLHLYL